MIPGFYDNNKDRFYPFIPNQDSDLPFYAVVDFSSLMLPGSSYAGETHAIWLHAVRLVGTSVEFFFKCDAPNLVGRCLLFYRTTADVGYVTDSAMDRAMISTPDMNNSGITTHPAVTPTGNVCTDEPIWEAELTTYGVDALATWLQANHGPGPVYLWLPVSPTLVVEPSTTQNLSQLYVRSLGIANKDRTRATTADGCRTLCSDNPDLPVHVVRNCLVGDVLVENGFNLEVTQNTLSNELIFQAAVGSGKGEPSNELPVFPDEVMPSGRQTYSGSLRCCDTINSINGVVSRSYTLQSGLGVRVINKPEQHRIVIAVDLKDMALCPDLGPPDDVECIHPDSDICVCGPEDLDTFVCPDNAIPEGP